MDIAKIRKKAKEKEEAGRAAEDGPVRAGAHAEPAEPSPGPKPPEEKGPGGQAGAAAEGHPVEPEEGPAGEDELPPPPPPVNKEGERGFSGGTETGAEEAVLELLTF